jgi:hypothetical protein
MIRCFLTLVCLTLVGCKAQLSESGRYAELRIAPDAKIQVVILADQWGGLVTPDGFSGMSHNLHYWATLHGSGPEYRDPVLFTNSLTQHKHRGVIVVDRIHARVKIDLMRVASEDGKPEVAVPSPANGEYEIKRITKDTFIPE